MFFFFWYIKDFAFKLKLYNEFKVGEFFFYFVGWFSLAKLHIGDFL